ncbi:MAG: hypothetical protein LC789_13450 [Actinobacteria bacterium]|nr:hypothetical protein [Actinomycetota bacterium]MCA1721172.1 hypothetical protein [Actinomycetota bacterium]
MRSVRTSARAWLGAVLAVAPLVMVAIPTTSAGAAAVVKATDTVNVRVAPNLSGGVVGTQPVNTAPRKIRCAGAGQQIVDTNVWFFIDSDQGFGGGWLTAYYTDAVYQTYDDLLTRYNIPRCDRGVASFNAAVYYQPRYGDGDPIAPYTTYTATKDFWSAGNCSTANAAYYPPNFDGEGISRASGWSLGRLGVTYLLQSYPKRAATLNNIILFDPGSLSEYRGDCDLKYDQSGLMANWLKGGTGRRLLILAGAVTRDKDNPDSAGRYHQGIQQYLFPKIRSLGVSSRVLVCNYDTMGHLDVMRNFGYLAQSGSMTSCPGSPNGSWHP